MKKLDKENIKAAIACIPDKEDEQLEHELKCALSCQKASEKTLLKPFIAAIEKERKKRGRVSTITAKVTLSRPKTESGAKPDDYE